MISQYRCRNTTDRAIIRYIFDHHSVCTNNGIVANFHFTDNFGTRSNPNIISNNGAIRFIENPIVTC